MINSPSHARTLSRRNALIAASVLGLGTRIGSMPNTAIARQAAPNDVLLGMTTEILCSGESGRVAGKSLALMRLTIHPGTVIEAHSPFSPVALYVESGVLGTGFLEGRGLVERVQVDGISQGRKEMEIGDDTRMSAGDHLFHDGAVHTMRNDGAEPLVLLVSTMVDTGAAELIWFKQD